MENYKTSNIKKKNDFQFFPIALLYTIYFYVYILINKPNVSHLFKM